MSDNATRSDKLISASMRAFLSNTKEMVFIKDLDFNYVGVSNSFVDLVEASSPSDLIGKSDFDIFNNEELAYRYRSDDESILSNGSPLIEYIEPIPNDNGGSRYSSTSKYVLYDDDGNRIGIMGISKDITKEYEAKLNYDRELRYLFELPSDAIFSVLFDITSWRVVDFLVRNEFDQVVSKFDKIDKFMEVAADSVVNNDEAYAFFHNFSPETVKDIFASGKRNMTMEYLRRVNGNIIWVREQIHLLADPMSGHLSIFITLSDIDKKKREQKAIQKAAERDSLTGLLNRAAIMRKIAKFLTRKGVSGVHALFMIDIDNFKTVNDTFGHQSGDKILAGLAQILRNQFSDSDFLGRLGGDEFFAFVKNAGSERQIAERADNLIEAVNLDKNLQELSVKLTCSIGISVYHGDGKSLDQLYAEADTALYRAKAQGKNRFFIFEEINQNECAIVPSMSDSVEILHHIGERLLGLEYDFVNLIELETGRVLYARSKDKNVYYTLRKDLSYNAQLDDFASAHIMQRDLKKFLQQMSLEYVANVLTTKPKHSVVAAVKRDGQIKYKKWQFLWFDDSCKSIILTKNDSSELAEAERDPLTGLYDRAAFFKHVRNHLDAEPETRYAIVRWDIDRFKVYNDIFGIEAGDSLLKIIADLLLAENDSAKVFGHIEADHFVALVPMSDIDSISNETLKRQMKSKGFFYPNFKINFSMGIYEITEPSLDVSLMCDRALLALKTVKNNYSDKLAFYNETLREQMLDEQALADDFEYALKSNQFVIYFQPQINYENGALIGAEALVRWNHPTRGLLVPDKFISLFERKGVISRLDEYVWEKTCQHMRSWLDEGLNPINISVNMSRADIYDTNLCSKLKALVTKYNLPVSALKVEITESAYIENAEQLIEAVKSLKDAGFTVEMDDFGAGYSSLNMLKDVPVDVLKLDVKFLTKSREESRGGNILSSILRMAHWLKLPVVAEGVEFKANADYLKNLGCIFMQGFYFSKPLPEKEFRKFLIDKRSEYVNPYKEVNIEGMGAFWDASDQMTLLFNSFVGGAAILELNNGNVEILRANDKFYAEVETDRENYLPKQMKTLNRFDETNRAKYLDMLKRAIDTGEETECVLESLPHVKSGHKFLTFNRVKLLVKNGDSYLFYLYVSNLNKVKQYIGLENTSLSTKDKTSV